VRRASRLLACALSVSAVSGLLACTWVPLAPGGEAVVVRAAGDTSGCQSLGKTHTRTTAKLGPFPRRESTIEAELVSLARNEAVRMGGNAVAPVSERVGGQQSYGIYRCP